MPDFRARTHWRPLCRAHSLEPTMRELSSVVCAERIAFAADPRDNSRKTRRFGGPCASTQVARRRLPDAVESPAEWHYRPKDTRRHVLAILAARRIDTLPAKAASISIHPLHPEPAAGRLGKRKQGLCGTRPFGVNAWGSRSYWREPPAFARGAYLQRRSRRTRGHQVVKRSTSSTSSTSSGAPANPSSVGGKGGRASARDSSTAVQCVPVKGRSRHAVHSTVESTRVRRRRQRRCCSLHAVSRRRSDGLERHHGRLCQRRRVSRRGVAAVAVAAGVGGCARPHADVSGARPCARLRQLP